MTQDLDLTLELSNYIIVRYEYEFETGLPAVFYHVQEQQDLSKIIPWSLDNQKATANKTAKTSSWDKAILNAIDCKEERVAMCKNVPKDVALLHRDHLANSIGLKRYSRLNITQTASDVISKVVTNCVVNYYKANKHTAPMSTFTGKTTALRDHVVSSIMDSIIHHGNWMTESTLQRDFNNAVILGLE